jgi:hypothetical protein
LRLKARNTIYLKAYPQILVRRLFQREGPIPAAKIDSPGWERALSPIREREPSEVLASQAPSERELGPSARAHAARAWVTATASA